MQQERTPQRKPRLTWLFRNPSTPQPMKFYYGRRVFTVSQDNSTRRRQR